MKKETERSKETRPQREEGKTGRENRSSQRPEEHAEGKPSVIICYDHPRKHMK